MNAQRPPIRYAPDLQEPVVLRLLERRSREGDRGPFDEYRAAADRIYVLHHDARDRRAAFLTLHAQWFDRLGCDRPLREALERLGLRPESVVVTRAWSAAEEEASVSADGRTLGIRLMVDRFGAPEIARILWHELGHVVDMLDPTFGYGLAQAATAARRRLEDRFGLLWDTVVDGRTARAGAEPLATRLDRRAQALRAFPELAQEAVEAIVDLLWNGARPTYAELLAFAREPAALTTWCGLSPAESVASAQSADWSVPVPGAPCPLCGFPTFAWERTIPESVAARIAGEFPGWSRARGACERCVEGYAVMTHGHGRGA